MVPVGELIGVVLAGGKSSRMGRPKELLEVSGVRLVDRMVARLREVTHEVWVSGEVEGHLCISDALPAMGPLGGLSSVLEYALRKNLAARGLIFVPVDMPQIGKIHLQELKQGLVSSQEVLAVHFEGFPLPMALRIHPGAQHILLRCITDSRLSVHAFLELLGESSNLKILPLESLGHAAFLNINTPEEFEEFFEESEESEDERPT